MPGTEERTLYVVELAVDPAFFPNADEVRQTVEATMKSVEDCVEVTAARPGGVIDINAVAKAIFRADDMVAKPDFAWGDTTAESYRRMAEAAVDVILGGSR